MDDNMEVNFESEIQAMDTVATAPSLDSTGLGQWAATTAHFPPELVCDTSSVQEIISKVVEAICDMYIGLGFDCDENLFNLHRGIVECMSELCPCAPEGLRSSICSSPT